MKKHNLFKVVMISIAIVVLLSWVVPAIYYNNYSGWVGTTETAKVEIGLFELVNNFFAAVWNFADIGIFILIVGGLYGVLHKISGYRNLLDTIVRGFKGREWIFLTVITVLFAVLSAMAGLSVPLLALFPFVISVILLMGYDKITAAMVTIGSTIVGLMGSVFSISNTEAIDQMLTSTADGNAYLKILLLVIGLALLLFNIILYARKHKDNKPLEDGSYIPVKSSKKEKIWPIVAVLDITLVILVLGFFSWGLFGKTNVMTGETTTWATEALKAINGFDIFGFKVFDVFFGITNAFGNWTLIEASVILVLTSGLLAFIYRMSFNDYITNFMNGAKRALKPAVLVVMSYVIMMLSSNFWCSIAKPFFELTGNVNVFTMIIVALLISLVSGNLANGSYLVLAYFLFFVLEVSNASSLSPADITLVSLIWQSINGIVMLVAPTSVIMLATLGYLHIPYGKWLKSVWLLFFELLAVVSIALTIISLTI